MSETKEKIIQRLGELIQEGEQLKNTAIQKADPLVKMWHMRCDKLLVRIGGEELVKEFNAAGSTSYNMHMSETEWVQYRKRQVEGRANFLKVTKEDLELFDDKDEPELKKIKHKFEGGVNLGVFKGKYTQERE